MRFLLCWLMGMSVLAAADSKDEAAKELEKLEGKWQFVSIVSDGKDVPPNVLKGAHLTISGKRFTLRLNTETHTGIITLNPSVSPKTIDIVYNSGPERGKKALGIYEVGNNKLKVCMGVVGATRPTAFASKPQSGHVLETLVKEKPAPKP